jgi:dTMP kinase
MTPETVTIEEALRLLSLPRVVGRDSTSDEEIQALNGKFGPYLKARDRDEQSRVGGPDLLGLFGSRARALLPAQDRTRPEGSCTDKGARRGSRNEARSYLAKRALRAVRDRRDDQRVACAAATTWTASRSSGRRNCSQTVELPGRPRRGPGGQGRQENNKGRQDCQEGHEGNEGNEDWQESHQGDQDCEEGNEGHQGRRFCIRHDRDVTSPIVAREADPSRGRLVVLEGVDGCGKSTQAKLLASSLGALLTAEPGATSLGAVLRSIMLDRENRGVSVWAEALLMAADRAEHVAEVIEPALADGRWVVCDRFTASTLAYQGYGRGLEPAELRRMSDFAASGLEPDLQILLDLPVATARSRTRRVADRMEKLGDDFFERVREGYLTLAAAEPNRWEVVDATDDPDTVESQILAAVTTRLGNPTPKDQNS